MKGPPHPWNEQLRLFPREHALWGAETKSLQDNNLLCGHVEGGQYCVGVRGHKGEHVWDPKPLNRGEKRRLKRG